MNVKKRLLFIYIFIIISNSVFSKNNNWEMILDQWQKEVTYSNNSYDIDLIKIYEKTIKTTYFSLPEGLNRDNINVQINNHIGYSKVYLNDSLLYEIGTVKQIQSSSLSTIKGEQIPIKKNQLVDLNKITIINYSLKNPINTTYKVVSTNKIPLNWLIFIKAKESLPISYALISLLIMLFIIFISDKEENDKKKYYIITLTICILYFITSGINGSSVLLEQIYLLSNPLSIICWILSMAFYIIKHKTWNIKHIIFIGFILTATMLGFVIVYSFNNTKIDIMIVYSLILTTLNIFLLLIVYKEKDPYEHAFLVTIILALFLNIINDILILKTPYPIYGFTQTSIIILLSSFFFTSINSIKKDIKTSAQYNNKLLESIEKNKIELGKKENEISELKSKSGEILREKSLLFSTLSRNLRAPLNSIIGYSENLYTTNKIEEVPSIVSEIIIESDKIFQAINNVMDFSNRDFTNSDLLLKDFRMKEIFDNSVYDSTTITAFSKNIDYIVISNSDKVLLYGNPLIFKQVISSVMNFLIELNPEKLEYTIYNTGSTKDHIDLGLKISAKNIKENELSLISSAKNNREVFTKYITLYNVEFQEEAGNTDYSINLKFQCGLSKKNKNDNKANIPQNLVLDKNLHILVVEDYIPNLNIVKMHLEKMGCKVLSATNGEEAISIFNKNDVDIILMDIKMPIMDGWEATEFIRSTAKGLDIPIVGLTASSLDLDIRHCFESGMDDVQVKPIRKNQLYNKLKTFEKYSPEKIPSPKSLRADYGLSKSETVTLFRASIKQIEKQLEVIEMLASAKDSIGIEREVPGIIHASLTINAFYFSRLLRNFFNAYRNNEQERQKVLLSTLKNIILEVIEFNADIFRD